MLHHQTAFTKRQNLEGRQHDGISIVISPSQLSFQRAYEALCVIGLVLTSILLVSHTFGRRGNKRHPIVIAFIATAMLNYWNALLPWLFNFWASQTSSALAQDSPGQARPTYFACRINGALASYLQTVIPSFAAAFVGEALRITWQVSKITCPKSASSFPDSSSTTHQALVSTKPSPIYEIQDFSLGLENGRTSQELAETPDNSMVSGSQKNSKRNIFSLNPGTDWKWPFLLCLVPMLCGLPQLLLILLSYLQEGKAWIFIDIISCRVRSEAAASLGVMTLLFVLALTALFSGVMLSILISIRRSASRHGRSNLDMALLIPIGFLSAQSIAGCLVVAVMYFTSKDHYRAALDLFGVINPIVSAFILTDWEFFTIWNAWIRSSISFLVTRLGVNKLSSRTSSSATLPNQISSKSRRHNKSKESADRIWAPPKPSYSRSHRLVSMSSIGDSDIEAEETYKTSVSRQATVTRPSRFRSLRKLTLRNQTNGASCRQASSSTRRWGIGVFKRLSCHVPHHSTPPVNLKQKVLPTDCSRNSEFSPGLKSLGCHSETCDASLIPEEQAGSESSKVEYFETVILRLNSEDLETNQNENTNDVIPWLNHVASCRRKSNSGTLDLELTDGIKKFNRPASKSL